jgi:hypothetical protein
MHCDYLCLPLVKKIYITSVWLWAFVCERLLLLELAWLAAASHEPRCVDPMLASAVTRG